MATVNFSGKWKHSKDEGFDTLLQKLGLGVLKRKAITSMSPQQEITQNGDEFVVTNKTTLKTTTLKFTVGQDFQFNNVISGKEETMRAVWEGQKLVIKNMTNPEGVLATRELEDADHMTITQQKGDTVAKRHFIKA
ncbi:cellular retinoic acid-binding protein 1-like [Diadema antillarum]|uniref:cellular retinoic acid-binding protein 1-like n=1 Tax=Diadema antillarum TaxID=105358 RepID=UPI003A8B2487